MWIYFSIILVLVATNIALEFKRDLMLFQQNSYRYARYKKWLAESGDTTSAWRLTFIIVFFFSISNFATEMVALPLAALLSVAHVVVLAEKKYKLPLVWTKRAQRIYVVQWLVSTVVMGVAVALFSDFGLLGILKVCAVSMLLCYCASHVITVVANVLLKPVEKRVYRKYYNEAADKLASMPDLKIIGITGSYGKTSTKHFLTRILSEQYDTLMTPGNFNTDLGVVRTIREYLKPYNEVFVVEMGAKEVGDIKVICDLVHPQAAIISSVGPQHLDTFKTVENIQNTKFELVDSLPADGVAILNNDFDLIKERAVNTVKSLRYGLKEGSKNYVTATDINYSPDGTTFNVVNADGWAIALRTRLVGECNISNLVAAVQMAHIMGVPDDKIKYAVGEIEQVEHRLKIKRTAGGVVVIDDAYNSNPIGSAMALDVLSQMKGGKRIVVTPGMVELGDHTFDLNKKFGTKIASSVDVAVVVCKFNREAIVEGIKDAGFPAEALYEVDTFDDAQKLLSTMLQPGDIVLYENDLPDTYK